MAVSVSVWSDVLLLNVGQSMNTFQSPPPSWLWSKHSRRAAFKKRCRVVGAHLLGWTLGPAPFIVVGSRLSLLRWSSRSSALSQTNRIKSIESNWIKSSQIISNPKRFNSINLNQSKMPSGSFAASCTTTVFMQTHIRMLVFPLGLSDDYKISSNKLLIK